MRIARRAGTTTTRTPGANRFQPIDPQPDALPMPNQTDNGPCRAVSRAVRRSAARSTSSAVGAVTTATIA